MRAQLLAHALRAAGAQVQVLTTSDEGARFLAGFDIDAPVLSRHYAVQFDTQQNMLRRETDRNVAHYMFRPERMLRDVWRLRARFREADLVVNDSFHPALLLMGWLPFWRRKVVHVYGASLRRALETNFKGRMPGAIAKLFGGIVAWQIDRSLARIEHDFAYGEPQHDGHGRHRLATPVAVIDAVDHSDAAQRAAAVYLNPHFQEPAALACARRALDRGGGAQRVHRFGAGHGGAVYRGGLPKTDPAAVDRPTGAGDQRGARGAAWSGAPRGGVARRCAEVCTGSCRRGRRIACTAG
jgi:hypothetical protein